MIRARLFGLLVPSLLLVGCATDVGPIEDPDAFRAALEAASGARQDGMLLWDRADWYLGDGHIVFGDRKEEQHGVVVLWETSLQFFTWSPAGGAYTSRIEIPYAEMTEVHRKHYGISATWFQVVVGKTVHSFCILSGGPGSWAPRRNNQAIGILREKVAPRPS